jgi:8-oxo-dGTP diphosphatase
VTAESVLGHGSWSYTTVLASRLRPVTPKTGDAESVELRWVAPDEVTGLPLHPGFAAAWPGLRGELDRGLQFVVDAANVVGSRPDGWWRDRAGAAARLRDRLAELVAAGVSARDVGVPPDPPADEPGWRWWPRLTLVVEGRARGTVEVSGVRVVSAAADGDSAIVAVAEEAVAARPRDRVLAVTADRELRRRVRAVGASVLGPGTLLGLLES